MVKHLKERKKIVAQLMRRDRRHSLSIQLSLTDFHIRRWRNIKAYDYHDRSICFEVSFEETFKKRFKLHVPKKLYRESPSCNVKFDAIDIRFTGQDQLRFYPFAVQNLAPIDNCFQSHYSSVSSSNVSRISSDNSVARVNN